MIIYIRKCTWQEEHVKFVFDDIIIDYTENVVWFIVADGIKVDSALSKEMAHKRLKQWAYKLSNIHHIAPVKYWRGSNS